MMDDPFIGEIRAFGFGFPPKGWALADGSLLSTKTYSALFSLYKTAFGGDGVKTFGLPDLRGRAITGVGKAGGETMVRGKTGGVETVTLTPVTMATHGHPLRAYSRAGMDATPVNAYPATVSLDNETAAPQLPRYGKLDIHRLVLATRLELVGGGEAHTNMQPYLAINYCVAVEGLFPMHG